ncbi:hypothetical protein CIB84_007551 [Bambusicola thoracicus]|nr:hypothetical protein CIB84_007551 [Bambusicola thoracicus]
MLKLHK